MKIFYIEDNPTDADLAQRALSHASPPINVEVIQSQHAALLRLGKDPSVDLVLTDMHLPDGSGLEIVSFLRENGVHLPVVIMTGNGDEALAVAALKAGAVDYIVKHGDYLTRLPATLWSAVDRFRQELAEREHPIYVLYVENDPADIELTRRFLARTAPHIHMDVVTSASEVLTMFRSPRAIDSPYDVLLLDYRLPEMTALELMSELRQLPAAEVPMALVTGQGSEEIAVQALRLGAVDYLVKNTGYLRQLPAMLENAHYKAELIREKAALKRSEERFRLLAENALDVIYRFRLRPNEGFEYISPSITTLSGYAPEDFYNDPHLLDRLVHPDDRPILSVMTQGQVVETQSIQVRWIHKDGRLIWTEHRATHLRDESGAVAAIEGIARDVTDRKLYERELEAIAAISATLRSASMRAEMLPAVLEQVLAITGADGGMINLINAQSGEVVIELGSGIYADKTGQRLPLKQSITGQVIAQGKTYITNDPRHDPHMYHPDFLGDIDSVAAVPLNANGETFGSLLVGRSAHPGRPSAQFTPEEVKLLVMLADNLVNAIQRADLFESLRRSNAELKAAYDATIEGWSKALDLRDKETEDHTRRVTEMTLEMAHAAGIESGSELYIRWGALLHDIGKLGVPDAVLLKPGPLNEEEWRLMKQHPEYANLLLRPISYLAGPALDIPYAHHERWDGSGYPRGLKGEEIPLAARIFAIIDVYDALTNDRPYRKAWSPEMAAEYIRRQAGTHFDPQVVELFFRTILEK